MPASPRERKPPAPGTARSALGHRDFRVMWTSALASSTGVWMQQVVLPAYIYSRTRSASTVAVFSIAQLGPMLVLSIPAGVMADRFERRKWLVTAQIIQMTGSCALGVLSSLDAAIPALFLAQLTVGVGNSLNAPAFSAVLPSLVPPADLGGAISLSSVSVNGSRVMGPVIAAALMNLGASTPHIFFINTCTYLIVMSAVLRITLPVSVRTPESGLRSLTLGMRIARDRPAVGRILASMFSFSLLSLPFVGLFPAVAHRAFGIEPRTTVYKWLYAVWGMGALLGALAVGTVLAAQDKRRTARLGFALFAVAMTLFATSRSVPAAFVTGFLLGTTYFSTTTSLMTVLQSRLELEVRARVLSLWFMAFGGTIPLGNMVFGPVMDSIGARPVLYLGAAWALVLAWWCDIGRVDRRHPPGGALPAGGT